MVPNTILPNLRWMLLILAAYFSEVSLSSIALLTLITCDFESQSTNTDQ